MNRAVSVALSVVLLACGNHERVQVTETATAPSTAPAADTARPTARAAAATQPPRVGDPAPEFKLTDHSGKVVSLSAARGRNVVLAFYRGHW